MRFNSARGGRLTAIAAVVGALVVAPFGGTATAAADPVTSSGDVLSSVSSDDGSHVTRVEVVSDRELFLYVYSAAMDSEIKLQVYRPKDTSVPRPVMYLLNGGDGGVQPAANWWFRTDAANFFEDKNINVVTPIGGRWSYYTDWLRPDPVLGVNMWTTFLTKELPPVLDAALGTTGQNAIVGTSTSGTAVLNLAIQGGDLYQSVGAISGCAQTSDPLGETAVTMSVETWGGGNTNNMWGPRGSELWRYNDPLVMAEGLRGKTVYVASGNGLPDKYERLDGPHASPDAYSLANQVVVGGVIEAATSACTHNLEGRLAQLGIPATFSFTGGTHSWGYWEDELHRSWPVVSAPLGGL